MEKKCYLVWCGEGSQFPPFFPVKIFNIRRVRKTCRRAHPIVVSVLRAYEQALNLDIAKLVECRRASQSRDSYDFGEGLASPWRAVYTLPRSFSPFKTWDTSIAEPRETRERVDRKMLQIEERGKKVNCGTGEGGFNKKLEAEHTQSPFGWKNLNPVPLLKKEGMGSGTGEYWVAEIFRIGS